MLNDQLNLSDHIAKTARSFIFALFNIKKRSGPFFQNMLQNSLFKLLFCPDWTIAKVIGLGWSSRLFYQTFRINPERDRKINLS